MEKLNPKEINTTALAYLGDAVYELYIRKYLMETGQLNANKLHKSAVRFVCADGQAYAIKMMMNDFLSEEEIRNVKRARNHKSISKPRGASPITYKLATAFEAFVGGLYLAGDLERMNEVMAEAVRLIESEE